MTTKGQLDKVTASSNAGKTLLNH